LFIFPAIDPGLALDEPTRMKLLGQLENEKKGRNIKVPELDIDFIASAFNVDVDQVHP
jgi:hypothetical protein